MNIVETAGAPPCTIVNVVATYKLSVRLNPKKISFERRDVPVKFNPSRFAAMTINIEINGTSATILAFSSGNVVHTGAKTEDESRLSAWYFIRFLNSRLNIPATLEDFKITNMVCDMKIGFEVNLYSLHEELGARSKFEPNDFPACRIWVGENDKRKSLIYFSGGCVLTGCQTRDQIKNIQLATYEICKKHPYKSQSAVSKQEYRHIANKKAATKSSLKSISKKLKKISAAENMFSDRTAPVIERITRNISRGKVNTKDAILYIRSLNPDETSVILQSESYVPYNPTTNALV